MTPASMTNDRPIRVLLVDDHAAVRHGIRQLITEQPDMVTIAESGSASAATGELARWADVAVIDYHLGGRDGLWLTQQIKQSPSPPPVLIYSAFADAALAAAAIVAGADGLLRKTALVEELCVAIRRLSRGSSYFPAVPPMVTASLRSRVEPRDRVIFSMLIHGVTPREICARLEFTPDELEERRHGILSVIAPRAADGRRSGPGSPLDYERSARRHSYPAVG
jgi:DNA-binding NarL/FixJ family response regulator